MKRSPIRAVGSAVTAAVSYIFWLAYGIRTSIGRGEKNLIKKTDIGADEPMRLDVCGDGSCDELMIVNSSCRISEDKTPEIEYFDGEQGMQIGAAAAFMRLRGDCVEKFSKNILITSAYRSSEFQARIYETNPYAVPAGTSEHETGLAVDMKLSGYAHKRFILTRVGRWINRNAYKYGFVVRYPFWGRKSTGIDFEPWHLRYVGEPHAEIMTRAKVTLEEYSDLFSEGEFYTFGDYTISYQSGGDGTVLFPKNHTDVRISPDNMGKYYIWGKNV